MNPGFVNGLPQGMLPPGYNGNLTLDALDLTSVVSMGAGGHLPDTTTLWNLSKLQQAAANAESNEKSRVSLRLV